MKFLIIGTGGVGGCLGGFLAASGEDVTLIARGAHLEAMRTQGLRLHTGCRGELWVEHPQAAEMDAYHGVPDVIFVCVKGYSLEAAERLIARVATPRTLIIPILNVVGTGGAMSERLPGLHILDGCVYIVSQITAPGEITQSGRTFRVVYGERDGSHPVILDEVAAVLRRCGMGVTVSEQIRRDCMEKFACVSPMAAAGAYYGVPMGKLRADPAMRADYAGLVGEVIALTAA
ncbi:MAG: 2-dehydropantoate 2-reductase N-terminal domain-containing protein, partial [Oscillospiraceae bacterium]